MKLNKTVFSVGILALALSSCTNETPWDTGTTGEGSIKLHLSSSVDLESEMPSVRSVSSEIIPPAVEDFQIRMTNTSGSYVKSWSSIAEFEKETEFRADTYHLEAFYGHEGSQGIVRAGDKGHEHSYFYGKAENIKIEPGKSTDVQIQASLGNSVVIIEYSDAFKNYFKDWSTKLITKGESSLDLGNEEGMCYVVPGDVDVVIEATQQNGKSVKLNPAIFKAESQHLYKIKYNVYNGEVGHADKLQVIFNDQPDAEHTIEIELTDDLLSGEGPKITTEGFITEDIIETLSGSPYEGVVKFHIDSPDGFSQVLLNISSKEYNAQFLDDGWVDLCQADADKQAELSNAGIKVLGLYGSQERMALIDLTEFCRYLPEGEHNVSLIVKDRARLAESSLKFVTYPVEIDMVPEAPSVFGRRYADIRVAYNGADPTVAGNNPFSFQVNGDTGMHEAKILGITKAETTRAFDRVDYIYRIEMGEAYFDEIPVDIYYNSGNIPVATSNIKIEYPEYEVGYDPMAKRVMMRVESVNDPEVDFNKGEIKKAFADRLRVFVDNAETTNLTRNETTFVVTAKGLAGGDTFKVKTSLAVNPENYPYSEEKTLTYEPELPVPNGDFSQTDPKRSIYINPIDVGGKYWVRVFVRSDQQITSSIERDVPLYWATLNDLTCFEGSKRMNSWYQEPSAFIEGNEVVIRSVGYNHDGKEIPESGRAANTTYYCENYPSEEELEKSIGELFLGTYSYNGTPSRKEGIEFNSRPSIFTFNYSYSSINNEKGVVILSLFDSEDLIIFSTTQEIENGNDEGKIMIPDYAFNRKVAKLEIGFKSANVSGSPAIIIPTGNDLDEGFSATTYLANRQKGANDYHAFAKGSELRVSNLKFQYD
ncbi:MAG: DUF4493 domain-containing protein [Muribaculaceae bacterium]|nr:DUF4493 domain-containing protein [Muribaculaceae bacterium]